MNASPFGSIRRVDGARIAGVISALPPREVGNATFVERFGEDSVRDVVKMVGVERRYWVDDGTTTADLCLRAACVLLERLEWPAASVSALVFVTQTPDYRLPATACSLHGRLGLAPSCASFDVNLGCSGYTYGLWLAMTLAAAAPGSRVLLLVGDTISRTVDPQDRATALLFGDAGTATAVESGVDGASASFVLGTDGAGARNLMIPEGAYRTEDGTDTRLAGRDLGCLFMDGAEIFNFTLKAVPGLVQQTLAAAGVEASAVDAFLLHQANVFMLRHLAKKMKLPADRVPLNIDRYGNTSSASIPLLITTDVAPLVSGRSARLAMAGFGVGYSWASALLDVGPLACAETVTL
jgi:3-oxoacyl-[acyl-carrier-protein] synthase-3